MTDAYILGGVRTPVGRYGGSLSHFRTDDLLGQTMVAACGKVGVPLGRIEDISAGCVNVAHEGMGDIARWGALAAGFPDSVPAVTVNRFCASSLTGAISIAHAIRTNELGIGLAAGVESMSRSGWAYMKGDEPFSPRGPIFLLDTMWASGRTAKSGLVGSQRLRGDDQDRAERGGSVPAESRGDRCVCPALPSARSRSARLGAACRRDPPGRDSRARKEPLECSNTTKSSAGIRRPSNWRPFHPNPTRHR